MRTHLLRMAEQWALHAYLRTCATIQPEGCVEEALVWSLFYLWADENLEEA